MQSTPPLTVLFSDLPNDGDTFNGPLIPAGASLYCFTFDLTQAWDNVVDNPRMYLTFPTPHNPLDALIIQHLSDATYVGADPLFSGGQVSNYAALTPPFSLPYQTILTFLSPNTLGPPTQGAGVLRLWYLTT